MYRQNYPDDPGMHNRGPGYPSGPVLLNRAAGSGWSRGAGPHEYRPPPTFVQTIKQSFLTVAIGLGIILVAIGMLFWNEGRAVLMYKSLDEGLSLIRSLDAADPVSNEHNHQLIHISGPLTTVKALSDDDYGVVVQAVKLRRSVEMYQWIEQERRTDTEGAGHADISYSYSERWSSVLIDSGRFSIRPGHYNPESMPVKASEQTASEVKVGNYFLSLSSVKFGTRCYLYQRETTNRVVNTDHILTLIGCLPLVAIAVLPGIGLIQKVSGYKALPSSPDPRPTREGIVAHGGYFYHSLDPSNPSVGDVRIKFEYAGSSAPTTPGLEPSDVVSIIGQQDDDRIRSFRTQSSDSLELLYMGHYSAQVMFGHERASNALLTWALRFLGWLLMFLGFGCWTSVITSLVDWVPMVRDLVGLGANLMNAALAISLSLSVIAIGWIWHRPLLSGAVLLLAALPLVVARIRGYQTRGRTDRVW